MGKKPLISVNYGIASSYDEFTEMHYGLIGDLREKIKKHEERHRPGSYTKEDFVNDFKSKDSYFFESFRFALKNPESLIGFMPIMFSYYARAWTFNTTALFPFIYFGLIFSGFFWLLFKINFFKSILAFTILFTLINLFLLALTHYFVKKQKYFEYKEVLD